MVSATGCVINNSPSSQTQESLIFCQHQDLDHLATDVAGLVEDLGLITRHGSAQPPSQNSGGGRRVIGTSIYGESENT